MSDSDDETDVILEEVTVFDSLSCKCEHESEDHGWDGCKIEGCACDASWEE